MTTVEVVSGGITLPTGVKVGAGYDTSQSNDQGVVVAGMVFPCTTNAGSTFKVFIPYSRITSKAEVEQIIGERANAVLAISG